MSEKQYKELKHKHVWQNWVKFGSEKMAKIEALQKEIATLRTSFEKKFGITADFAWVSEKDFSKEDLNNVYVEGFNISVQGDLLTGVIALGVEENMKDKKDKEVKNA